MEKFIKEIDDINLSCISQAGYKSAYIGELHQYNRNGLLLANGFVVTTAAYKNFISYNDLENQLIITLNDLRLNDAIDFEKISLRAKQMIMQSEMPADLGMAIIGAYDYMCDLAEQPVCVSTSFTFEMPFDNTDKTIETNLNVQGHCALLYAVRKCFANLFSISALHHIALNKVDIGSLDVAVCIQKMIRADKACAGAGLTTDLSFKDENVMHITGSWGLGNRTVGLDNENDEYWIFKPSLAGKMSLLEMKLGAKTKMLMVAKEDDYSLQTIETKTPGGIQHRYVLNLKEIEGLGKCGLLIEQHFKKPMLFRWAKDGLNNQIYILSIHPEDTRPKLPINDLSKTSDFYGEVAK
ncbi:PEP/pyruvate-binding domain-containing protein [Mucilaginibacter sp.]|jgi:pyruvate,water dikinase|uniref:PEP/pyruvate-binding domain-containing protein n=1 Tax=Mucilaginibacter sp. TaxID=1882438 RepID=UPI00263668E0|nr:PEP/pyruvate-binding domain-containing protein [Mucilaginibacter sp.]MDB5126182.1 ppsA [Mucilaginibacter sp.]